LISQLATSKDVEKINREIIEGVKFTFVSKNIIARPLLQNENLLDINQIQGERSNSLYNSGEELLEDILKKRNLQTSQAFAFLVATTRQKHFKNSFCTKSFLFYFSFDR
jgi:hypothetical protein